MNKIVAAFIVSILFFLSCKTPAVVSKTQPPTPTVKSSAAAIIIDSMQSHGFHFEWFSGKAKFEILDGADKTSFTANFRIRNDSAIWISISPALGIEVARVLITKDSIRVIDRLNNDYYSKDYRFFKKYTSQPIDYKTVQDLIAGNPLFTSQKEFLATRKDSSYFLESNDQATSNAITLDHHYRNVLQNLQDDSSNNITVTTQQYDIQYTPSFSLWRKILLRHPDSTEIIITFSKVKINEPLTLPFKED